MADLKEHKKAIISESVTHQGIGGKEIELEKEFSLEEVFETGNIAAVNFMERRMDLVNKGMVSESDIQDIISGKTSLDEFNAAASKFYTETKVYYGHVGIFGYYVCEDEIEML